MDLQESKERMVDFWSNKGFELNVAQSLERAVMGMTVAELLRMADDDIEVLLLRCVSDETCEQALQAVNQARAASYKPTRRFYEIGRRTSAELNPFFI